MLGEPADDDPVVDASVVHGFRTILATSTPGEEDCILLELDTMCADYEWTLRIALKLEAAEQLAEMLLAIRPT